MSGNGWGNIEKEREVVGGRSRGVEEIVCLVIRRRARSTPLYSSAASDVYKGQKRRKRRGKTKSNR